MPLPHHQWSCGGGAGRPGGPAAPRFERSRPGGRPPIASANTPADIRRRASLGRGAPGQWGPAEAPAQARPPPQETSAVQSLPHLGERLVPDAPRERAARAERLRSARRSGGSFEQGDDYDAGSRGADVVYAKSWGAQLSAKDETEGAELAARHADWIADERRMALAGPDAIYMHPLPADRNIEVADAVIDGPHSVVYDQAENRLHVQTAVLALTMR
jgi:N-acetylornithine carbamoyltransferase